MKKDKQKDIHSDVLTPFERTFVDEWFNNGFNGRRAYKTLRKDNANDASADAEASRILSLGKVKDYIELKREEIRKKQEITLEYLVQELKDIIKDVNTETTERDPLTGKLVARPDRRSKIEAIKVLSKLGGLESAKKIDVTSNGQSITLKDLISFDE
jgi:hypothetical protein